MKQVTRRKSVETIEIKKFNSVKNWFESLEESALSRNKNFSDHARNARLSVIVKYSQFTKRTPDELLEEAKRDIKFAKKNILDFFSYLQDVKKLQRNSAITQLAFIRGFYTHNDLNFPKRFVTPKRGVSQVSKRDQKTKIYDYDEATNKMIFHNGTLQQFIQNLNFRDQTVTLCLLSTGADATDLLNLNVDFVKDVKAKMSKVKRFIWHSNREKDGVEFKVYFSEEATQFLKRFVEQERVNANDNEPLFIDKSNQRLKTHALSFNFKNGAKKMGYVKEGEANPFRPKRFRHLFRTACAIAEIDGGYVKAMMGHSSDISAGYLEKNSAIFKKIYLKVEPFLTVFGANRNLVNKMSQEVNVLKNDFTKYSQRTLSLEDEVKDFKEQLKSATKMVYSFEPILNMFNEIANTTEGQELIKRIHEAKMNQELKESQEETDKERAKITKEHLTPKKVKRE